VFVHVRFVCMKMKRLQTYFSLLSILHLLALACGGAFANEILKNIPSVSVLSVSGVTTVLTCILIVGLYVKIFTETSNK
jgi:hypothetical protein